MTARTILPALLAFAGVAAASPGHAPLPDPGIPTPAPILGGSAVPPGKWRDAAGVIIDGGVACSGVLIAPTIALTAGHCSDPQLESIIVGTHDLDSLESAEIIPVVRQIEYPDSWNHYDIAVLVLAQASTVPPRALATGWARFDIIDQAEVALVGYGAIDRYAQDFVSALQQASSVITDATCAAAARGCNAAVQPNGELGAGGGGIDTCPGDSGGPLYLVTPYGEFLAGITSRAYNDAEFYCEDGGIYGRPDAIVDWIEAQAGVGITRGPEPAALTLTVTQGAGGEGNIEARDPRRGDHEFALVTAPTHGEAVVRSDGRVRYCSTPDHSGADSFTVDIKDPDAPHRHLPVTVAVEITAATPPTGCSLEFDVDPAEGGGCCSASGGPARLALPVLLAFLGLGRRRKRD
jgi:endonuclease G